MTLRLGLMALVAAAFVALGTGCANSKQAAERDSLLDQNKKLQDQLQAEQAARIAAESRANAATSQVTAESNTAPGMGGDTMTGGALDMTGTGAPGRSTRAPRATGSANSGGGGTGVSSNSAGEIVLEIPGDVLFDSGKTSIKPAAQKTLDGIAAKIKKEYAGQMIRIEGHTDSTPVKTAAFADNYHLGFARAEAVMAYLEKKGVSAKNMYPASFGSSKPKSTKNQALNRRVDIVIVKNAK